MVKTELRTLERASNLILSMLPDQIRLLAEEMADIQYHCPRWHVVAGAVLRLSEEGRMADYATEPHWATETMEREPRTCKFCEQLFDQERVGQDFCSNECGTAFEKGDVHDKRPVDEPDSNVTTVDDNPDSLPVGPPKLSELLQESAELSLTEITG